MACKRCGKCCETYDPFVHGHEGKCKELTYEDGIARCKIYNDRWWPMCTDYLCPDAQEKE